jgi:predicted negative regulator of RcsB-dependent stress response
MDKELEVMSRGQRKRDLWKSGIIVASVLFLLLLMMWVPLSATSAHEKRSGSATSGAVTVQTTATEDATVTALNKEKLMQEVEQLKQQNAPNLFGWLRTNAAVLLSTLVVVIGGLIGLFRWFGDRHSEREKQAEVRFQAAVTGLGDEKEGARIGAAILLRTFLQPDYKQFYVQTFDLAVANLRLPGT